MSLKDPVINAEERIAALEAEIERLRIEREELLVRYWKALDKPLTAAMGVASTTMKNEIEQLRADNVRLRECMGMLCEALDGTGRRSNDS